MKEPVALPDIQLAKDSRNIDLQHAGVSGVEMPLQFQTKSGKVQIIPVTARLTVELCKTFKGVHMSRFVTLLSEWSENKVLRLDLRQLLQDTVSQLHSTGASISLAFRYFVSKKAPVTGLSAPMAIPVVLDAESRAIDGQQYLRNELSVEIPISTLCPCSKAIARYGAHNQRTIIRAQLLLNNEMTDQLFIEDIVEALENCASSPVYPVLKRPDEKHVTERQYENPKFVEDVLRDAIGMLRSYPGVMGFSLIVESLESIHGHNAWAAHKENL